MAALTEQFHFLGINFKVNSKPAPEFSREQVDIVKEAETRIQSLQSQVQVTITVHERCCVRAMDKISAMEADIVHPMKVQRYLCQWATWWSRTAPEISKVDCLTRWSERALVKKPKLAWIGVGLIKPLYPSRFMSLVQLIA